MSEVNRTTQVYCRSTSDGAIEPAWSDSGNQELRGHFKIGVTIADRYLLQRELGGGAMGRVYLAKDLRLDRPVAMKVVAHHHRDVDRLESMLQREAKLGANLNHRGVAAVYDFGLHDNKSYTIFEYVEGETLRKLLERRGKLPLADTVRIAGDLAAALDFAHLNGVVHRDLKPENVCYTKQGEFKILDLGIALDVGHDLQTGAYSGTPAYSSPEQAECRPTDGKSDQYALALIVYEILTGEQAFVDSEPLRLLKRQAEEPPPNPRSLVPDLPESAELAILKALSKQPSDRFATCQEFARELGSDLLRQPARHVVHVANENRIAFYIAHVAEESLLARHMGEELERRRFPTWFYGRDAIPGVPFGKQAHSAIERTQSVVALISRPALRSGDLEREIEHAHRIGCPILPLLIDISREEFEKGAPAWCRMLGPSPTVEYRRPLPVGELSERLVAAAKSLSIAPAEEELRGPLPELRSCTGPIWATDANQIDIGDLDRVLFRNATIDDYLNRKHRYFISATKGFGKTLLLTCKRHLLTQSMTAESQQATMVPEGRPYLDFMSELRSLSSRHERPLSDVSTSKRLWNTALRISAVSHHPAVVDRADFPEVDEFPPRVQRWLRGVRVQPTVVFKELTGQNVSQLNRLIDASDTFLDQKMRQIHGATYFFIDKVDQAIRHLSRDAWIAVQAGLIEAAWETMSANSHLKIYASIRQEAFSNYQSDIKANLFSATTNLNYSDEELQALLNQLAHCYEGASSFSDFLGLNVVRHGRRPVPEDSFEYVRRHTCGRPRDLVAIASELSAKRGSLNERRLREVVRETSSNVVVANIFSEVEVFLNCLTDRESRQKFLLSIHGNILDKSEAIGICEQFNGLDPGSLAHFGEDSGDIFHPFLDLYVAGLLGVVEYDPEMGIHVQRFRRAHDALAQSAMGLPESTVFLIHPALDNYIRTQRTRQPFLQYQHVPVGDGVLWHAYSPTLMRIEQKLEKVEDAQFVDLAHQVVKRLQALLNSGEDPVARFEIAHGEKWKTLWTYERDEACCEVLFWLGELLEQA